MPPQLDTETKIKIIELRAAGFKLGDIVHVVGSSTSTVQRWIRRWQRDGTVDNMPRPGAKRAFSTEQVRQLERLVEEKKATHTDLARYASDKLGVTVTRSTISRTIRRKTAPAGLVLGKSRRRRCRPAGDDAASADAQSAGESAAPSDSDGRGGAPAVRVVSRRTQTARGGRRKSAASRASPCIQRSAAADAALSDPHSDCESPPSAAACDKCRVARMLCGWPACAPCYRRRHGAPLQSDRLAGGGDDST